MRASRLVMVSAPWCVGCACALGSASAWELGGMSWPTYERIIITRGDVPRLVDMRADTSVESAAFDLYRTDDAVTPTATVRATMQTSGAMRVTAGVPLTARATVLTRPAAMDAPGAPATGAEGAPDLVERSGSAAPLMSDEWYRRARLEQMALRAKGRAAR